jgi:RNA-directed DNA polymerase
MEQLLRNMNDTQRSEYVCTIQQRIAELARERPHECFTALNHYLTVDWLKAAYERVKPDSAPGVDGQSWSDYGKHLEENLRGLLQRVKSGSYFAPPVKRVHIPKGDGKETRGIGMPTIEDKLLQRAIAMLLEPIFEQDFKCFSYGFRPGRSAHQALACIWNQCTHQGIQWILEVDIRKYLDPYSYYTFAAEGWSKSCGWLSKTRMRRPFCLPRLTWTTLSSPRFTRCMIVCRETPRMRMA